MSIELLKIEIRTKERLFRQIARKGIVALYEVRNKARILISYELLVIRFQPAFTRKTDRGKVSYPTRERYPSASEFGKFAWSLPLKSRALAELFFDQLASMAPVRDYRDVAEHPENWPVRYEGPRPNWFAATNFLTGRPLPKTVAFWNPAHKTRDEEPAHPAEFDHLPENRATFAPPKEGNPR